MKIRDIIKLIESDGWYQMGEKGTVLFIECPQRQITECLRLTPKGYTFLKHSNRYLKAAVSIYCWKIKKHGMLALQKPQNRQLCGKLKPNRINRLEKPFLTKMGFCSRLMV
jgi:hypothetical protein